MMRWHYVIKNKRKKLRYFLGLSVFAGVLPVEMAGVKWFVSASDKTSNSDTGFQDASSLLIFNGKYISLRSNPMNNFVSLTTENGQYTYALCDTADAINDIKYAKNTGVAKIDNATGKVVALWVMGSGQSFTNLYTTNIVFGDTEDTLYVLAGIRNPAKALNDVYGNAVVPTKMCSDTSALVDSLDSNTAYFTHGYLNFEENIFTRNVNNNYKVNISGYTFDKYTPIKIIKLSSNLIQQSLYSFEFPPADAMRNSIGTIVSEYDKTIIAGFGGGQHLNYWSTNALFVDNLAIGQNDGRQLYNGLMNSSFFHYLQFGQVFDYLGNEEFLMVPKYIGIDPNIGGLYSMVSSLTKSLASLSSYMSLYQELYRHKGSPDIDENTKTLDFNNNLQTNLLDYQYRYLDNFGKVVNVTSSSEFALRESTISLILLSFGYFMSSFDQAIPKAADISLPGGSYPGWMLSNYGVVCFSPLKFEITDKYKLYTFNRFTCNSNFFEQLSLSKGKLFHFVIDNMFVQKDSDNNKHYVFYLKSPPYDYGSGYHSHFNADMRSLYLFGTFFPSDNLEFITEAPIGFTWKEFANSYDTIKNVQTSQDILSHISFTTPNSNYYNNTNLAAIATGGSQINQKYYNYAVNSIYFPNKYEIKPTSRVPLGWGVTQKIFSPSKDEYMLFLSELNVFSQRMPAKTSFSYAGSHSGSKYIFYSSKMLIADPVFANRLVMLNASNYRLGMSDDSYKYCYSYAAFSGSNIAPYSTSTYDRISNLFLLGNNGFGYVDYKNRLVVYLATPSEIDGISEFNKSSFKLLEPIKASDQSVNTIGSVVSTVNRLYIRTVDKRGNLTQSVYYNIDALNSSGDLKDNVLPTYKSSDLTMWIIIGAAIVATMIIALGLGIGIPMRKNAKLQLATTRLSNKKIDMLSSVTAKSLKKLAQDTNMLIRNQRPRALTASISTASAVHKPAAPKPAGPVGLGPRPTTPVTPRPAGPVGPGPRPTGPVAGPAAPRPAGSVGPGPGPRPTTPVTPKPAVNVNQSPKPNTSAVSENKPSKA